MGCLAYKANGEETFTAKGEETLLVLYLQQTKSVSTLLCGRVVSAPHTQTKEVKVEQVAKFANLHSREIQNPT